MNNIADLELPFSKPFWLKNAHAQTIVPALYRRIRFDYQERFQIVTPDDDVLWADYFPAGGDTLAIISHGLEGSSERHYVLGLAKALAREGISSLAWNYRGCLNGPNKQLRFYHSGATEDLHTVIGWAVRQFPVYKEFVLAGFSLGGNLTLKYLGEGRFSFPKPILCSIAVSVPLDLSSGCDKLSIGINKVYENRFLRHLGAKVKAKAAIFPELDTRPLKRLTSLRSFDEAYTAPIHGFQHAEHYYQMNSSLYFLEGIAVPTLIIQSADDPMLSERCFPHRQMEGHPTIRMIVTSGGGHVGFVTPEGLHAESHAEKLSRLWVRKFR